VEQRPEPLPLFSRLAEWTSFAPGLDRVRMGAARLGRPFTSYPHVLVGGTNGKGTVTASLARGLPGPVGTFLSPHIYDIRERICIDGVPVPDDRWRSAYRAIREAHQLTETDPDPSYSYFEWLLLLAIEIFRSAEVRWAVFEVGLGGRLDAVNILDPVLSIITNVGLDHVALLGPDEPSIALEKIEIARNGRPLVLPVEVAEMPAVANRLSEIGCLPHPVRRTIGYGGNRVIVEEAARLLGVEPPEPVRLAGRRERLSIGAGVILDGAHNEPAWRNLAAWVLREHGPMNVLATLTEGRDPTLFREIMGRVGPLHVWHAGHDRELSLEAWPEGVVRLDRDGVVALAAQPLLVCGSLYGLAPFVRLFRPAEVTL